MRGYYSFYDRSSHSKEGIEKIAALINYELVQRNEKTKIKKRIKMFFLGF